MSGLSTIERSAVEQAGAAPMLAWTESWTAINSGTRNLPGLARMADALAAEFSRLPGALGLIDAALADSVAADGTRQEIAHGRNLHLAVRPDAPVQILLTGHMDTVFGADHPFQSAQWLADGTLNAPGALEFALQTAMGELARNHGTTHHRIAPHRDKDTPAPVPTTRRPAVPRT